MGQKKLSFPVGERVVEICEDLVGSVRICGVK